jgi:SAM-dependent methyltransferase
MRMIGAYQGNWRLGCRSARGVLEGATTVSDEIQKAVEPLGSPRTLEAVRQIDAALESGEIDEETWYQELAAIDTPIYLAQDTPWGQSGKGGDEARWEQARRLIIDAIDRDGTFLDVGCASGYLMECVHRWARAKGLSIEPYGLDIAPELADLARRRLPHWAKRIYVGNIIHWEPPQRFDFVRTGLEYVPVRRQRDLVEQLLREVVAPGGRLIIGACSEKKEGGLAGPLLEERVSALGFAIAGRSERPHSDHGSVYRVLWIDSPGR